MGKMMMGAMGFMLGAGMMMTPVGRDVRRKVFSAKKWMKNNL